MYLLICSIFSTIQLHVQCYFTVTTAWISLMTKELNMPSCIYLLMLSVHWILLPILWASFFLPFDLYKFSVLSRASLVAQMVKNLQSWEIWVWSLGRENPLEKGMATHSNILAWRILWTVELGWLQFMGLQRMGHHWATNTFTFYVF